MQSVTHAQPALPENANENSSIQRETGTEHADVQTHTYTSAPLEMTAPATMNDQDTAHTDWTVRSQSGRAAEHADERRHVASYSEFQTGEQSYQQQIAELWERLKNQMIRLEDAEARVRGESQLDTTPSVLRRKTERHSSGKPRLAASVAERSS